jgi:AcrR family transcriptional regulator
MQATMQQLLSVGYEGVSVREIAAAAGVAPTTIYRRWGSRPELVLAALKEMSAETIDVPDTGELERDLRALIGSVADALSHPALRPLLRSLAALPDDIAGAYRRSFWGDRQARTRIVIERAVARGELPAGTDPANVLEALIAPVWFRLLISGVPLDEDALDRWTRAAIAAR